MEKGPNSDGRDPSGFLSEIIGAPVTVKLNSGVIYKGIIMKVSPLSVLSKTWFFVLKGNFNLSMAT